MLSWERVWTRTVVTYICAAVSQFIAVYIEIALVSFGLVETWLDRPIFFELSVQITYALGSPIVLLPCFVLAELIRWGRGQPFPPLVYCAFSGVFTAMVFFMYDFGGPLYSLLDLIPNGTASSIVLYLCFTIVAATCAFGAQALYRAVRPAAVATCNDAEVF